MKVFAFLPTLLQSIFFISICCIFYFIMPFQVTFEKSK